MEKEKVKFSKNPIWYGVNPSSYTSNCPVPKKLLDENGNIRAEILQSAKEKNKIYMQLFETTGS